ncbi:MAG: thiamine-phosphate kinase [Gammaproteobacteria bacterium]
MDEFELIHRYFSTGSVRRDDVTLGIGDDAAILQAPEGHELAVSVDSLVAGVHFPAGLAADSVGHRALAVNLSDLAAMGAQPAWALLALTLPENDERWLANFAHGFFALAQRFGVALVGGNLACGPLNVSVTVHGFIPAGQALSRKAARPGDHIFVTGYLGDAAAGLEELRAGVSAHDQDQCVRRFGFPEPRITAGLGLRGIASSMIDISDGLAADLSHMLEASRVGARIDLERLPLSPSLLKQHSREQAQALALSGGDDYELCFSVPPERLALLDTRKATLGCTVTPIGEIAVAGSLRVTRQDGSDWPLNRTGYKHF